MTTFTGTGVAMATPFTPSGEVDYTALERLTDHIITGSAEFLVALGSTGESATISAEERGRIISAVQSAAGGRVPVVVGCGGNNTAEVSALISQLTRSHNPDGFLSVSPAYNKPSQEGIFRHFREVARHTGKPVILYNVPGRTGSNMLPETVVRIARECSNVIAVKEASGSLSQCMDLVAMMPQGFLALSGDDDLAIGQIAAGFHGVISVVAQAAPRPFCNMVRAALSGDFATARELHYKVLPLIRLLFAEGNPAGVKAALEALTVCSPTVRLPLVDASDSLKSKIAELLKIL